MKVFMLGWEFPPYISGGLGTACHGLTKGLDEIGVEVCFVLPTAIPVDTASHVEFRSPTNLPGDWTAGSQPHPGQEEYSFEHVQLHQVDAVLQPYGNSQSYQQAIEAIASQPQAPDESPTQTSAQPSVQAQPDQEREVPHGSFTAAGGAHYDGNLMGQVHRYARLAVELAEREKFDVIHAHDWMTFPAAMAVAAASRKPLVVHIHSTEFDRSGINVNQQIYDIERMAMHTAGRVICVSFLTKNIITSRYGVEADRVEVVYNAVDIPSENGQQMRPIGRDEKIVLFLGRLTMQKGPEYFLRAAKKVVEKFQNVRFVVAGAGDMIAQCVREVADLKLGKYVTFTGFLRGPDVAKVFSMADLYVMPSVSEPFGIAPLEAMSHNVPVIISRQSGVSEVLTHVLKVDFWDTDEMANKMLAVLRHPPLQKTLRQHGHIELSKLSWHDSAVKLKEIYAKIKDS